MRRTMILFLLLQLFCCTALAEEDADIFFADVIPMGQGTMEIQPQVGPMSQEAVAPAEETATLTAREDFIDRIIAMGYDLYVKADGRSQRAHYKGDIYLCKNFTTHIFNELRDDFCMAEYPNVRLRIPNNQQDSSPYKYGLEWENVSAKEGNPFYIAASFRYDKNLSKEENFNRACEFMRQAQRGDFFQMSADYEYGMGAHSAIMMGYDEETDEIHWMDSNMRGGKNSKGIRYGLCQYDEVRSVEWWAEAFCHRGRGATLYRLRDDIAYREGSEP